MQAQAEKAEKIVSKVRAYAKGEMPGRKTINLAQASTEAIKPSRIPSYRIFLSI